MGAGAGSDDDDDDDMTSIRTIVLREEVAVEVRGEESTLQDLGSLRP